MSDITHNSDVNDAVVETPRGTLVGERAPDGSLSVFKGVPYALPPTGDRRWRPPVPVEVWCGPRLAKTFGPAAMQQQLAGDLFYADSPPSMSEDCLTLNIWTPTTAKEAPVMVWFHGGNLLFGSGSNPRYDGAALAKRGVIVVTINYRLGIFGYLAHAELSAESAEGVSGNYGTLDQIEALRWVRENIEAFGGDPGNVTIFGQSAGALSVTHLMASPLAQGLFHRGVAMSAYLPTMPKLKETTLGMRSAEAIGHAFGEQANANSLSALRAISKEALLEHMSRSGFITEGVVDGWVHPQQVFETFESGAQAKVPLIIGFTSDETRSFSAQSRLPATVSGPEDYETLVQKIYGDLSNKYITQYPSADPLESHHAAMRDGFYGYPVMQIALCHSLSGAAAYLYYFSHVYASAAEMGLGAFHSCDVPFAFENVGADAITPANWPAPPNQHEDIAVSKAMAAYWTAFARTGRPDAVGCPLWEPFLDSSGAYMNFAGGDARPSTNLHPGMFALNEAMVSMKRALGLPWWRWANIGLSMQDLPREAALSPQLKKVR